MRTGDGALGNRDVTGQFATRSAADRYARDYAGSGTAARYFRSRLRLVSATLASCEGGDLLDVGCGPGMMVRELLDSRPEDFRITALDSSPTMVEECVSRADGAANVTVTLGDMVSMPFQDSSFDVVLAMGALEYTDLKAALTEIRRVLRPDGRLVATMLNPRSHYRLFEWHLYWPFLRFLACLEQWLHVPQGRRHGVADSGIRAYPLPTFRKVMQECGLSSIDVVHYDVTFLVPPIDDYVQRYVGYVRRHVGRYREPRWERTVSRGWKRFFGTAYMVVAVPD